MPKTFITQRQRDKERIKKVILGRMAASGFNQADLAAAMGITRQTMNYKIKNLSFTLLDLADLNRVIHLNNSDVAEIIGNDKSEEFEGYLKEIIRLLKKGDVINV